MTAFPFDTNPNEPTKLGLIVLSSDETIEDEFRAMLPKSCSLFQTRIHSAPEVTPDTLMEMKAGLAASSAMIPPSFNVDVIGYACTSGATMIGPCNVATEVQKVHPNSRVCTPITAVMRALNTLGAQKIGMVTPYIPDVSQEMRNLLIENGFEISALVSFEVSTEAGLTDSVRENTLRDATFCLQLDRIGQRGMVVQIRGRSLAAPGLLAYFNSGPHRRSASLSHDGVMHPLMFAT